MKINKLIYTLALCLSVPALNISAKDTEALPFIRIVRDPASGAMGFAGVASSSSIAYSSFSNPAMIPFFDKTGDIAFSYQNWAPDGVKSSNFNLGAGFKLFDGRLGFGFGGAFQNGEKYDTFNEAGVMTGSYTPNDMQINLGASSLITKNFSFGINLRYARQSLSHDNASYETVATDMFIAYRLNEFNFTAGLSSLGSSVKSASDEDFTIPTSATLGAEWHRTLAKEHGIKAVADFDYFFSDNVTAGFGAQYSWKDMVFIRTGYHFGSDKAVLPSFLTLGGGIKHKRIRLDAAWLTGNDAIKNSLSLGLGIMF